uniref:Uncharacterized protein n=1 Tax=Neogobius melanostomus TaxID=47308 RepID=A0A8C6X0E9_9GOBI
FIATVISPILKLLLCVSLDVERGVHLRSALLPQGRQLEGHRLGQTITGLKLQRRGLSWHLVEIDSHESVLPLTFLQSVFDESSKFYEEQLLRGLGRGPRAFGLTVLFAQRLGPSVT